MKILVLKCFGYSDHTRFLFAFIFEVGSHSAVQPGVYVPHGSPGVTGVFHKTCLAHVGFIVAISFNFIFIFCDFGDQVQSLHVLGKHSTNKLHY